MSFLLVAASFLPSVSNSNGVNSNRVRFYPHTFQSAVSNSNGVNSNGSNPSAASREIRGFQTPTE